jgi:hypothetical protein
VPTVRGEPGIRLTAQRTGRTITATLDGRPAGKSWRLQLAGVKAVTAVKGGASAAHPLGVVISPARGTRKLRVTLPSG